MRKIFSLFLLLFLFAAPLNAAGKTASELRRLAQAGASLIIDLDINSYSVAELLLVAAALTKNATLTLKSANPGKLSLVECLHLAQIKPGQVIFWF